MHSGAGQTSLNKILACANAPPISNDMYKKYEKIIGKIVEDEAKASLSGQRLKKENLSSKILKNLCKNCKNSKF